MLPLSVVMIKKQFGEKEFALTYRLQSILVASQSRDLKQNAHRYTAY